MHFFLKIFTSPKVDKEGAVTGLEKLEKLQKIKKIDRLISENNLLISKLPIVDSTKLAGLKRKSGLGGGGSEKLRRCYAVEEDEEVQVVSIRVQKIENSKNKRRTFYCPFFTFLK